MLLMLSEVAGTITGSSPANLATIFQVVGGGVGTSVMVTVVWMLATGRLVPGSVHEQLREDRDWYRERYSDGKSIREDRDWYRDKFAESTDLLSTLLSTAQVEESERP